MKKDFKNRRELAYFLNEVNAKVVAEGGVRDGDYSKFILDNTNVEMLYAIDPWEFNPELATPEESYNKCESLLSPHKERSKMVKGYSPFVCDEFEDESLDFVYIDGMHDYASVRNDINGWFSKVKTGGIIAGHDYHSGDWPGVVKAVDEFVSKHNYELNLTGIDSPDYEIEHDGWKPSWWFVKE
jgi:hypothetical protein